MKDKIVGLMTFYPTTRNYSEELEIFFRNLAVMRMVVQRVFIVDDGFGLNRKRFIKNDVLVSLSENIGKAGAVRTGLKAILESQKNFYFIAQCDYDDDQTPEDIPILVKRLESTSVDLVVGDRYVVHGNQVLEYRKDVLQLQQILFQGFGFNNLKDAVSGLSVYTKIFAEEFLKKSCSERNGLEIEKVIIAFLSGFKVDSAPLTFSRNRSGSTKREKILENLRAILNHQESLRCMGMEKMMDLFHDVYSNLALKKPSFIIDLNIIGINKKFEVETIGEDDSTLKSL